MNWNYLIGPICGLVGILVTLFVKDQARDAVDREFGKQMAATLAAFKLDLIESMDKIYVRKAECMLTTDSQDDRIDIINHRLDSLDARANDFKNILRTHKGT